jgi:signal transduction histidine kinase/ligand-binding sensor domain-containing protein
MFPMSPSTSGIRVERRERPAARHSGCPPPAIAKGPRFARLAMAIVLDLIALSCPAGDAAPGAATPASGDPVKAADTAGRRTSRQPPRTLEAAGYLVRRWGIVNGLPADEAISVIHTSEGYLWASFMTGLARFDGYRFNIYRSGTGGLAPGIVQRLHQDSRGRLLAVREGNRPLIVFDAGHFSTLTNTAMVDSANELTTVSGDGTLWKLNPNQGTIWRLLEDEFVLEMQFDPAGVGEIRAFAVEDGHPWINAGSRLFRLTPEGAIPYQGSAQTEAVLRVQSGFFRRHDGALLVLADQAIHRIQGTNCHRQTELPHTRNLTGTRVCLDRFGTLWSDAQTSDPELVAYFPDGEVARSPAGRSGKVMQIIADSEGNVWAACRDGLFQSVPVPFQTPQAVDSLSPRQLVALTSHPDGRIWMIGDWQISLYSPSSGTLKNFPNVFTEQRGTMVDAAVSRDGTVWIAEWSSHVARVSQDAEQIMEILTIPRTARHPVSRVFEATDGSLWLATLRGLWLKRGDALTQDELPQLLRSRAVFGCAEDPEGRLYVATKGIVFRREHRQWREELLPDPMKELSPMALEFGPDGTGWWLGQSSPLTGEQAGMAIRTRGQWIFLDSEVTGLDCRAFGLAPGKDDALWVSSPERGLFRFSQRNLLSYAAGETDHIESERFTEADGMPSASCNEYVSRGLHVAGDGRVWVPTTAGPTSLDPARLRLIQSVRTPPRTRIEEILVDDRPRMPWHDAGGASSDTLPRLTLPPRARRIEIHYTGVHLTAPAKVRFRYRLHGYDSDWVEAGNRRTAYYQNLPPGNYRFEVMSALGYKAWHGTTASLGVRALPVWWQTLWFRTALGLLALAILWFTRLVKLRQLTRERIRREEFARRLIESQEAERKRIAGELHDSMGQSLLIAKNQLYLLQVNADSETQSRLRQVADNVGSALDEARNISHQLRPFQLERLGLSKAINSMLKQASDSTGIPIHSRIISVDSLLPPESEVMVYRMLQEALSNIVKHADASEVQIVIEPYRRQIRMVVRDDGRGFDPAQLLNSENPPSGLGLTSFQERTNLLRGQFHCQTAPGNGTTLTFEIPIPESRTHEAEAADHSR